MKHFLFYLFLLSINTTHSQELYVFSEPASNMPAHSLSIKQTAKFVPYRYSNGTGSRHTTELMFGVNKHLMVHTIGSFSDMYGTPFRFEGARMYGKYRFLSTDALYRHFRMAAYGEASYSKNISPYEEVSIDGDQSGIQLGLIGTQLLHKLALSGTAGYIAAFKSSRPSDSLLVRYPRNAIGYSLSAGYLVFPKEYTDYKQTNFNLYLELLGQQSLDSRRYFADLAPAAQLIFDSQAKLNIGYRFQLGSNMTRMGNNSWLISFEWLFLNALR